MLPYPADNVSDDFNRMALSGIKRNKALLGLFKKSIPHFVYRMTNGSLVWDFEIHETLGGFVETTKVISSTTRDIARDHLDPFEMLSEWSFGQ